MNIKRLLLEPGRGWLRWGMGTAEGRDWIADAHAYYTWPFDVYPPLRRLWITVTQWPRLPVLYLRWHHELGGWPSWEEASPQSLGDINDWYKDPDR